MTVLLKVSGMGFVQLVVNLQDFFFFFFFLFFEQISCCMSESVYHNSISPVK